MKLTDPVAEVFKLKDDHKAALGKLRVKTVRDLLYHFPARYEQAGDESSVGGLVAGQEASVVGTLEKLETKKGWKSKIPMSEGYLRDQSGRIKLRWFHQPYIAKMYAEGSLVKAVGKVSGAEGKLYLANPQLTKVSATEAGLFEGERKAPAKRRDEHDPNSLLQDFPQRLQQMIADTSDIPPTCQWATFLRNHDEISLATLPAVDRERLVDALDPEHRFPFGKGQTTSVRVATALGGDKEKTLRAFNLLYGVPGAPIMYYGDELGMPNELNIEYMLDTRRHVRGTFDWREAEKQMTDPDSLWSATARIIKGKE
jgi:hypothetical protein